MSWQTPPTFTADQILTSANANIITGDLSFLAPPDAGAQSTGVGNFLLWDSVDAGVSLPAASITTPTLDQSFAHLMILWEGQSSNAAGQYLGLRQNADSGAHYYGTRIFGSAASASVVTDTAATSAKVGYLSSSGNSAYPSSGIIWIPNYSAANSVCHLYTAISSTVLDASSGNMYIHAFQAGKLDSGSAITSLTFLDQSGSNLIATSRFSVYGVKG